MAAKKENDQKGVSQKQTMINEVALKISTALDGLKEELGIKKFEKRTRKAAKLLLNGIKLGALEITATKKSPTKKSPTKKVTPKKNAKALPARKSTRLKQTK